MLFVAYIQVIWAKHCYYLSPLTAQRLKLGSLNWAAHTALNTNIMTLVCPSKARFLGCLIWPQDSQATPNTSPGLLFAAEVKCVAQPMSRAACMPSKSQTSIILAVMVPASFLDIDCES